MRQFKTIDIWVSIGLILCSLIISLIKRDGTVFVCYFIVGAWQLVSIVMHVAHGWFKKDKRRLHYYLIVAGVIVAATAGIFFTFILYTVMFFLLFLAPVMACYYAWLCYHEVFIKMQRPLAFLK